MPAYDALMGKKQQLIRRARKGSVFAAATSVTNLTTIVDSSTKLLAALPAGWKDLGWLSDDGAQFSSDIDTTDVTSWGSMTPTRTDINSESTELQVTCQETNLPTIGLYVGVANSAITANATSGEVKILKPLSPMKQSYRLLSLAVDENAAGEIYIGRYWPNAEVINKDDFSMNKEDSITWPVTFAARPDSALGSSEVWFFGGPGWFSMLSDMGITTSP